jgi:DNA-binding MarR family transcriptional regulator
MTLIEAFNLAKEHGVSAAMLHPLLVLIEDSPLCPTDLCARTGNTAAAMTGMVDRMVERGWADRLPSKGDRRKTYLIPSKKAFEIFTPMLEAQP